MNITDIAKMPNYNSAVKNGAYSVTEGKAILTVQPLSGAGFAMRLYPTCILHGAMLKVSKDGIWRCGEPHCPNGCYQL